MGWADWPGAAGEEWPNQVVVCRGIYGKAHRVRTDFRWLACSAGLEPHKDVIRDLIRVGPTDRPTDGVLWRTFDDGFLAIRLRKSLARDADRRPGMVERDVLWWKVDDSLPVAAAAAALLVHAQHLKPDWWKSRLDSRWQDEDFCLPLDDLKVPVIRGEVESTWQKGLASFARGGPGSETFKALKSACTAAARGAGASPTLIHWPGDAWGADEISAFLLAFESGRDVSVGGTVASDRIAARDLFESFDVVVVPPDVKATSASLQSGGPDAEQLAVAHAMKMAQTNRTRPPLLFLDAAHK